MPWGLFEVLSIELTSWTEQTWLCFFLQAAIQSVCINSNALLGQGRVLIWTFSLYWSDIRTSIRLQVMCCLGRLSV